MGLRTSRKVAWDCDGPSCSATGESDYVHTLPENWIKVDIVQHGLPDVECTCKCHEIEQQYDNDVIDHDEYEEWCEENHYYYNCEACPDEDTAYETCLCSSCAREFLGRYRLPRMEVAL